MFIIYFFYVLNMSFSEELKKRIIEYYFKTPNTTCSFHYLSKYNNYFEVPRENPPKVDTECFIIEIPEFINESCMKNYLNDSDGEEYFTTQLFSKIIKYKTNCDNIRVIYTIEGSLKNPSNTIFKERYVENKLRKFNQLLREYNSYKNSVIKDDILQKLLDNDLQQEDITFTLKHVLEIVKRDIDIYYECNFKLDDIRENMDKINVQYIPLKCFVEKAIDKNFFSEYL